ncbi:cation:proton antiporter [Haloferacaceae archaeon DSL9]
MSVGGVTIATDLAIVIVTATVLAYLARKTKQPTIIAYLFTGLLLGPVALGIVSEGELLELIAELGLGFLLFVLGIEMRLDRIREILRPVINIAIGQTILQTALALAVAVVLGFSTTEVIVISLATVFGATPVIVKVLSDKDEMDSLPGRIDIGVLIVQDIYLVIILALVGAGAPSGVADAAVTVGRVLGLMALVGFASYLAYRYFLPPLLRMNADDRDVLFVIGLAWAFVFIFVGETLGLTVEVGAFLAGLSLAQLPYSTELKERIRPVTDFFLVIFFASIGLQLTAGQLFAHWRAALAASAIMMVGNFLIMFALINREGFTPETTFVGSANMVQVSEFSLVVGTLAVSQEFIGEDILGFLALMALLTMSLSTYIIRYNYRLYERFESSIARFVGDDKSDPDLSGHEDHAVVVGYGPLARRTLPILHSSFEEVVVVDRSPDHEAELADRDAEFVYGDIKHGEIRDEAGVSRAAFVLSTLSRPDVNRRLVTTAPSDATVFVAADRERAARTLYADGADYVVLREPMSAARFERLLDDYLRTDGAFDETARDSLQRLRGGEIDG